LFAWQFDQLEEREDLLATLTRIESHLATVRTQLEERQRALVDAERKLAEEVARTASMQSQVRGDAAPHPL
jgi:hypothetical protein